MSVTVPPCCFHVALALTLRQRDPRRSPVHDERPPPIALEAHGPRVCALWQRR